MPGLPGPRRFGPADGQGREDRQYEQTDAPSHISPARARKSRVVRLNRKRPPRIYLRRQDGGDPPARPLLRRGLPGRRGHQRGAHRRRPLRGDPGHGGEGALQPRGAGRDGGAGLPGDRAPSASCSRSWRAFRRSGAPPASSPAPPWRPPVARSLSPGERSAAASPPSPAARAASATTRSSSTPATDAPWPRSPRKRRTPSPTAGALSRRCVPTSSVSRRRWKKPRWNTTVHPIRTRWSAP